MQDVVIVGGGASGTALFYVLSRYTRLTKITLLEKYGSPGQVNTKASNNSQTLHTGDIETNYSIEKVKQVYPAAMMVAKYAAHLPESMRKDILFKTPKMVLGVGEEDAQILEKRFEELSPIFPKLRKLYREDIARVEPNIVKGRPKEEKIVALYTEEGYAVDFERLAESFVREARKHKFQVEARFNAPVEDINKIKDGYELRLSSGEKVQSRVVVVDADSYSLLFAKSLGLGKHFSLIPIAGSFYFSRELLNGKVYTVQDPKLPFAAVHGDPDVRVPGKTRWGPTARFHPVLESFNFKTSLDYLRSSGLNRGATWVSFFIILLDPTRLTYLLKNMLYELPFVGRMLFIHNVRKIVPSINWRDIEVAKCFGGMRLQRVDTDTRELQLGEGKIVGENIIFNMTPSPGASVALYNALRDAELIVNFIDEKFDKEGMEKDLCITNISEQDISLTGTYAA